MSVRPMHGFLIVADDLKANVFWALERPKLIDRTMPQRVKNLVRAFDPD